MSSFLLRRSSAAPLVSRQLFKTYATSTDSSIKVATTPATNDQTAAITVVVKAGSRHEPSAGLAHVLKNSLFKVSRARPLPARLLLLPTRFLRLRRPPALRRLT